MSEIDLSKLSPKDLVKLSERIEREKAERRSQAIAELRERWKKEAEAAGFTFEEVVGKPAKRRSRAKPAPKYRHPDDPSKTWSGRGKKPVWLQEQLDQGRKLEEFAV